MTLLPTCELDNLLECFNQYLKAKVSLTLMKYQVHVARELLKALKEHRFVVVSMPTGSGKTLLEEFVAFYAIHDGFRRVLVLEPTRFLCDQMCKKQWSRVFDKLVGKEYEGECYDFFNYVKRVVISTPKTALKCIQYSNEGKMFDFIVIDEVHHAFSNKYYRELLSTLKSRVVVGFTALLPSEKLISGYELTALFGPIKILHYDFKKLKEIDPDFKPPLAVADIYDSELDEDEIQVYDMLLSGRASTISQLNSHLMRALVSHGRKAFCESYEKSSKEGKALSDMFLEQFCRKDAFSHKTRTLIDVIEAYKLGMQTRKLTLIYTRRRATAHEAANMLKDTMFNNPVEILTGDMSREDRLKLLLKLQQAKETGSPILVSTQVGEEGIDIPEAWLLIMLDVTKSPLKFYQRVGRLIRMGSPEKLKYLVLILTPRTYEYDNLEEVLWRLYCEGVDISYIITNIDISGKTTVDHVVKTVAWIQEQVSLMPSIPYIIYQLKGERIDLFKKIEELVKSREFQETLNRLKNLWGVQEESIEMLVDLVFVALTASVMISSDLRKEILEKLGISKIKNSKIYEIIKNAIRTSKLYYIYDVDALADLVEYEINRLYNRCPHEYCSNIFFRLDDKVLLRFFTQVFTPDKLDHVLEETRKTVNTYMEILDKLNEGIKTSGNEVMIHVYLPTWVEKQKSLIYQGGIWLTYNKRRISLDIQINYYDVDLSNFKNKDVLEELFELNVKAILYKAVISFLESLLVKNMEQDSFSP